MDLEETFNRIVIASLQALKDNKIEFVSSGILYMVLNELLDNSLKSLEAKNKIKLTRQNNGVEKIDLI